MSGNKGRPKLYDTEEDKKEATRKRKAQNARATTVIKFAKKEVVERWKSVKEATGILGSDADFANHLLDM